MTTLVSSIRSPMQTWPDALRPELAAATKSATAHGGSLTYTAQAPSTQSAVIRVDPQQVIGRMPRLEQYHNFPRGVLGPMDQAVLGRLPVAKIRVWLSPGSLTDPARRNAMHQYLDQAADVSQQILATVSKRELAGVSIDEFEQQLYDLLLHLKRRYPHLCDIEALNEYVTDQHWGDQARHDSYFQYYLVFARVLHRVNAELSPTMPLRLGGPVHNYVNEAALRHFFANVAMSGAPLHFVSIHQYLFEANHCGRPALLKHQGPMIRRLLAESGLDPTLPIYASEHGLFPQGGIEGTGDPAIDRLTQAAGMLTNNFHWLGGDELDPQHVLPFHWCLRHPENSRKNILEANLDGQLTPYGASVVFQSWLKQHRVAVQVTSPASADGIGLHAVATADERGVALLVWNYQWVDGRTTYQVRLEPPRPDDEREQFIIDSPAGSLPTPQSPAAGELLDLQPNHIAFVRFEHAST